VPVCGSARFADGSTRDTPPAELTADVVFSAVPWRAVRSYRGQQHLPGLYWSSTTGGHVVYESRLELARLLPADFDPGAAITLEQLGYKAGRHPIWAGAGDSTDGPTSASGHLRSIPTHDRQAKGAPTNWVRRRAQPASSPIRTVFKRTYHNNWSWLRNNDKQKAKQQSVRKIVDPRMSLIRSCRFIGSDVEAVKQ
jgi:hypothetical protein